MLTAIAVAALLCSVPYLVMSDVLQFRSQDQWLAFAPFAVGLVATTLYASLLFSADQRGRSCRFLAEHAAWPRFVWLTRLAVWLVPVLVLLCVVPRFKYLAARALAAEVYDISTGSSYWLKHGQEIRYFVTALEFAVWGILLGFAVGQACSLFFRRAIVAGFAATVISIPLLVWGFAIWSWELPPAQFLLPLVIGLFTATWLRVPDWIIDRNSLRAWSKVAAAVLIPIVSIVWMLPRARELPPQSDRIALAQIANAMGINSSFNSGTTPFDLSAVVDKWIVRHESAATDADRAADDRLIRLSEMIEKPPLPTRTATDPDPTRADWDDYHTRLVELNRAIIDEATALSGKEYVFPPTFIHDRRSNPIYDRLGPLVELLGDAGATATQDGKVDDALKYYVGALRLCDHLSDATPTGVTLSNWNRLRLHSRLVEWAGAKGQSSDRIRAAIAALDTVYPLIGTSPANDQFRIDETSLTNWSPPAPLMIEYLSLRDILLGKQPSNLLAPHASLVSYFPVLVNELHFERDRALKLLDYLFVVRTALWRNVVSLTVQDSLQSRTSGNNSKSAAIGVGRTLRGLVQLAYESGFDSHQEADFRERDYPPYSWVRSSILLREELKRLGSFGYWIVSVIDRHIAAWGLRQQLALVAYEMDHGAYPDSLDRLVPNYLSFVPIDPYSGLPFEYRSHGLPLEFFGDGGADSNVAAGTPLLWSVGAGDARLRITTVVEPVDPNADPSRESEDARRSGYKLERDVWPYKWYINSPLVFPLPKLPAKSPNLPPP